MAVHPGMVEHLAETTRDLYAAEKSGPRNVWPALSGNGDAGKSAPA